MGPERDHRSCLPDALAPEPDQDDVTRVRIRINWWTEWRMTLEDFTTLEWEGDMPPGP